MKLRTAKDLKTYLLAHSLSPERFAAMCGISNMTVRRWVKHDDAFSLPQKYWPLFDQAFSVRVQAAAEADAQADRKPDIATEFNFAGGFSELEKHVHSLGENAHSKEALKSEFKEKVADVFIAKGLIDKVKLLFKALTSKQISHYQRTLVLGAIVYFISPIDLIPDATPVIGYLDDYAVVTMVLASVAPALLKKPETNAGDSSQT
jgi:uncharacterized membrane protein YkvA (DUF1232 family)